MLDVGCGTGINIAIPLAEAGYSVVGIDSDRASIERARALGGKINNLRFECQDVRGWTGDGLFHVTVCSEVLEHIAETQVFLSEIRRLLVPDGLLLVTVPNGYGYFEFEQAVERVLPWLSRAADRLQHFLVRRFGGRTLRARHHEEWLPAHYQMAWTTLAKGSHHAQHFTVRTVRKKIEEAGFRVEEMVGRTFLAGNILNSPVRDWDGFLRWNVNMAACLPLWMCSGWMIVARKV